MPDDRHRGGAFQPLAQPYRQSGKKADHPVKHHHCDDQHQPRHRQQACPHLNPVAEPFHHRDPLLTDEETGGNRDNDKQGDASGDAASIRLIFDTGDAEEIAKKRSPACVFIAV